MTALFATYLAWAGWVLSWWIAGTFWSDRPAVRVGLRQEWLYRVITMVGAVPLFGSRPQLAYVRFWIPGPAASWLLFGLVVVGIVFTWWARLYLGRLWSSSVTRKADHHVVDTGPYAIVRHPIYTGMLFSALATAALKGTPIAFVGVALWIVGFWIKARLEEGFLREQLGSDAYDSYRRRVPMLVPFGPKSA